MKEKEVGSLRVKADLHAPIQLPIFHFYKICVPRSTDREVITHYPLPYWSNGLSDPGVSAWQTEG